MGGGDASPSTPSGNPTLGTYTADLIRAGATPRPTITPATQIQYPTSSYAPQQPGSFPSYQSLANAQALQMLNTLPFQVGKYLITPDEAKPTTPATAIAAPKKKAF
jgi:hypothetical protein